MQMNYQTLFTADGGTESGLLVTRIGCHCDFEYNLPIETRKDCKSGDTGFKKGKVEFVIMLINLLFI